jgi:glycerol uptake facilitator-like aquaporin
LRSGAIIALTGIAPAGVFALIAAQIAGALCGVVIASLLYRPAAAPSAYCP